MFSTSLAPKEADFYTDRALTTEPVQETFIRSRSDGHYDSKEVPIGSLERIERAPSHAA